jgi:hypothetical protein
MSPMFRGILWIVFIICLFAGMTKARGQEMKPRIDVEGLNNTLKGKDMVYQGSCWFDKKGILTFKKPELVNSYPCMVFMDKDQTKHYVLYNDGKYGNVILFDEKTKEQTFLWSSRPSA